MKRFSFVLVCLGFSLSLFADYQLTFRNLFDYSGKKGLFVWGIPEKSPAYMLAKIPYDGTARLSWPEQLRAMVVFVADGKAQSTFESYVGANTGKKTDDWIEGLKKSFNQIPGRLILSKYDFYNDKIPSQSVIKLVKAFGSSTDSPTPIGMSYEEKGSALYQEAEARRDDILRKKNMFEANKKRIEDKVKHYHLTLETYFKTNPLDHKQYLNMESGAKNAKKEYDIAQKLYLEERKKALGY